jgi:hypothetical protein
MSEIGKYIYGIIKSDGPHTKTSGVGRVHTIPYQDISAVVSDSEIVDYTQLPKDAVARHLIGHQQVIQKIMENFNIIPVRLGTFAYDGAEVNHILAKGYPTIKDIFNKINDKIEIDVVATWSDFNLVLKEVGEEEEIKQYKERLLANPKGITVDDQMKVGVMVEKALDKKREKYAFQIHNALKTVSQDFKVHEVMDDKMVINTAFLINKAKRKDFDRKVEELDAEFTPHLSASKRPSGVKGAGLNFRCVGPLPPYSFYTLEVVKLQFEEIDWARKRLRLNGHTATREEIKKAYQRAAFSSHPDKYPDIAGIEGEFDHVTKAYKVLLDYCQANSCSLKEEDLRKNAILVKLRE